MASEGPSQEPPKSTRKRKRTLEEVIAELPSLESIQYTPLRPIPREPQLNPPSDLDIESRYALFSLFFTEDILETISHSTNAYAKRQRMKFEDSIIQPRAWKDTSQQRSRSFLENGPIHLPQLYMTQTRFEQLKRFLHVSNVNNEELKPPGSKDWWYKLGPLASSFHEAAQRYYIPGPNLSVDEVMVRCAGQSLHTYKMPHKPIKQGYKVFSLAEHGYIWTFSWSSRQIGREEMFKQPELTPTGSIVVEMINRLPKFSHSSERESPSTLSDRSISQAGLEVAITSPIASYSIYMDNYFSSVALFNYLYDHQYGACGTARPSPGIPSLLQALREHAKSLPWGTLYALPVSNVLCLSWHDNNIVLGLSALHSADGFVSCKRRRPGKTSTNGAIARRVFGGEVIKELDIPLFIYDSNHYMNGVDLTNQYRASYEVHLKGYRNWLPLLYFFINAAIVNAYRVQYIYYV
ncbi:hypothetical protein VTO42DRAFT_6242 [Malbranchea cinnamomea]